MLEAARSANDDNEPIFTINVDVVSWLGAGVGALTGACVGAVNAPGAMIVNDDALRLLPAITRPLIQPPAPMDAEEDTSNVPYQRQFDPSVSEDPTIQKIFTA